MASGAYLTTNHQIITIYKSNQIVPPGQTIVNLEMTEKYPRIAGKFWELSDFQPVNGLFFGFSGRAEASCALAAA
jgi:hypothetical protein